MKNVRGGCDKRLSSAITKQTELAGYAFDEEESKPSFVKILGEGRSIYQLVRISGRGGSMLAVEIPGVKVSTVVVFDDNTGVSKPVG